MLYLEYESFRVKYLDLCEKFNEVLSEKERLLTKALPSATRYDKEPVKVSVDGSPLEDYAITVEEKKIDKNLCRIRKMMDDRKKLLDIKENELRKSQDIYDKIYLMRYIDGYGISAIANALNYSKSQVYRKVEQVKKRCDKMRQNAKNNVL